LNRAVSDPTQLSTKPDDSGNHEDYTTFFYNYLGQRIDSHGNRIPEITKGLTPLSDRVGPVAAAAVVIMLPSVAQATPQTEDLRIAAQNLVSRKSGRVKGDNSSKRGAPGPCPTNFTNFQTQNHSRVRKFEHDNAPASAFGPTVKSEVKAEDLRGEHEGNEITRTVENNWVLSMVVGRHRWNFLGQRNPATRFSLSMRAKKGASPWCTNLNEDLLGHLPLLKAQVTRYYLSLLQALPSAFPFITLEMHHTNPRPERGRT
jgi:hypothetical protein